MTSRRERMLTSIRTNLQKTRAELEAIAKQTSQLPPPFVHPAAEDLAAQFVDELTKLCAQAHRCNDDAHAIAVLEELFRRYQPQRVLAWDPDQIGVEGFGALLDRVGIVLLDGTIDPGGLRRNAQLASLEQTSLCISGAQIGIAESGTIILHGGQGRNRLASLIAPIHIALLRETNLVRGLGEALSILQERYGDKLFEQSSNLTLISGPSRTADIEQTLTLGAHGPRALHVLLIGTPYSPTKPTAAS